MDGKIDETEIVNSSTLMHVILLEIIILLIISYSNRGK